MIALTLNTNQTIENIKESFALTFPYLKLEFFKHKHKHLEGNAKKDLFESNISLKELPKKYQKGFIHVTEEMSVSTLEQSIEVQFGLSAQVFRKSGKSWLETTKTDDWTLKHQNEEGKAISLFIRDWKNKSPLY